MKQRVNGILFCALSLFAFCTFFLILHLSKLTPKDYKKWAKLVQASKANEKAPSLSEQLRHNISKEIYIQGEKPYYLRMDSTRSKLMLCAKNETIAVQEAFEDIKAFLQERCYYLNEQGEEISFCAEAIPMQSIRIIHAKKALFNYTDRELWAEDVDMYCYEVPGHTLPLEVQNKPHMVAKANRVQVEWEKNQEPYFHCIDLQASLASTTEKKERRYIMAPHMTYLFKEEKMLFESNEIDPVYFYDAAQQTLLSAKKIEAFSVLKHGRERIVAKEGVHVVVKTDILEKFKRQSWLY